MYKTKATGAFLFALIMMATICCSTADKSTIYVNVKAAADGDGSTWQTAYSNLQHALDKAIKGNEIWVASGTYLPTAKVGGASERNKSFQLKSGVALYGGFIGSENNLNQRDWPANKTILSGDLKSNDQGFENNSENSFHVVIGNGTDSTAVLDGFVISAGNADAESWPDDGGGGISNFNGSPTISNCTFTGNAAFADGGGMRNWGESYSRIHNCIFTANKASQEGGGMMNGPDSKPLVTNSVFTNNHAGEDGGGMYVNESYPSVINCIFKDNRADLTGAGMYTVNGSSPRVINCTFSGNKALKAGGALSNLRGNPVLINCILWGNSAPTDPEIHNNDSNPKVANSCISRGYSGNNNQDTDPLFRDQDLRLSMESSCIDAGDNKIIPADIVNDFEGKPRIYNGIVDMGAYEYNTN